MTALTTDRIVVSYAATPVFSDRPADDRTGKTPERGQA